MIIQYSTINVEAHGKIVDPMGASVSPKVAVSSQSDVAIGVTQVSPCGTTLGRPFDRNNKTPRAEYYPGQTATMKWYAVNQDGGGPVRVRFSGDNGASWKDAQVQKNAPGVIGLDAGRLPIIGGDGNRKVKVKVPNMDCPPGKCMMTVTNPITFGNCVPVSIQPNNTGKSIARSQLAGNSTNAKGLSAGGLGGVLDALNL